MLFNPTEKYASAKERLEYTDSVRLQLKHNGISLSDIKEIQNADGTTVLVSNELF